MLSPADSNPTPPATAKEHPMPQPETNPRTNTPQRPARLPPSPARQAHEQANAHVGLITRAPEETPTGRWEAEWWNGPTRKTRDYATEAGLIIDLRRLFGPAAGDPDDEQGTERTAGQ